MKKPKSTKVLGIRIPIEYKNLRDLFGYYDVDNRVIYLDRTLEGTSLRRVLKHEKMHAVLRLSGFSEHLTDELEENLCTIMENISI